MMKRRLASSMILYLGNHANPPTLNSKNIPRYMLYSICIYYILFYCTASYYQPTYLLGLDLHRSLPHSTYKMVWVQLSMIQPFIEHYSHIHRWHLLPWITVPWVSKSIHGYWKVLLCVNHSTPIRRRYEMKLPEIDLSCSVPIRVWKWC